MMRVRNATQLPTARPHAGTQGVCSHKHGPLAECPVLGRTGRIEMAGMTSMTLIVALLRDYGAVQQMPSVLSERDVRRLACLLVRLAPKPLLPPPSQLRDAAAASDEPTAAVPTARQLKKPCR